MIDLFASQASDSPLRQISLAFFNSGGHQPEGSRIVTTAVLVGAVVLAYFIWRRLGGGAAWNRQSGATVLPREISSILEQAMVLRSRIDMSFHPITTSRQTISCTLFELSETGITLEMPLGVTPSDSWMDKRMVCYFRIPRENRPPYFYTFISSVAGVWKKGDISYVVLTIPSKVELGQKRKHLRLELPPRDIKDFRVWPAAEDGTFHFESDPGSWPKPLAVYTRDEHEGLRVLDLSGGGIKLAFDPHVYDGLDDFVAKHPILFMRLELENVGEMTFTPYYLAARLRTKVQDPDHKAVMLGYEFVECCAEQGMETIDWIKVDAERGIDELVTWVFKRHLELYREREIV